MADDSDPYPLSTAVFRSERHAERAAELLDQIRDPCGEVEARWAAVASAHATLAVYWQRRAELAAQRADGGGRG